MSVTIGMVRLCSSSARAQSLLEMIATMPAFVAYLLKFSAKVSKPVDIFVEYGSVPGGTGDYLHLNEQFVSPESTVHFEGSGAQMLAWINAFQGKAVDPNDDTFWVKVIRSHWKAEAWSIVHEVIGHIVRTYNKKQLGYYGEHDKFGLHTNPYQARAEMKTPEPPKEKSPAALLMKEFEKLEPPQGAGRLPQH